MGQTESKDPNQLLNLRKQFQQVKKFDESGVFGDGILMQSKADPSVRVLMKQLNFSDPFQFQKSQRKVDLHQKLSHPNLLNMLKYFHLQEQQLCGSYFRIYLLYEYCDQSLLNMKLSEQDLWTHLNGCVQALAYLQQQQIQHSQISLKNIFLSDKCVKIVDFSLLQPMSMFVQILQDPKRTNGLYLSPLLVKALQQNNWQPKHNQFKSDVFSLGMSFIQLALGESLDDCYRYQDGVFKENVVQQKLQQLYQRYPGNVSNMLTQMIQPQEELRFDFIQLSDAFKNLNFQTVNYQADLRNPSQFDSQPSVYQHSFPTQEQRDVQNIQNIIITPQFDSNAENNHVDVAGFSYATRSTTPPPRGNYQQQFQVLSKETTHRVPSQNPRSNVQIINTQTSEQFRTKYVPQPPVVLQQQQYVPQPMYIQQSNYERQFTQPAEVRFQSKNNCDMSRDHTSSVYSQNSTKNSHQMAQFNSTQVQYFQQQIQIVAPQQDIYQDVPVLLVQDNFDVLSKSQPFNPFPQLPSQPDENNENHPECDDIDNLRETNNQSYLPLQDCSNTQSQSNIFSRNLKQINQSSFKDQQDENFCHNNYVSTQRIQQSTNKKQRDQFSLPFDLPQKNYLQPIDQNRQMQNYQQTYQVYQEVQKQSQNAFYFTNAVEFVIEQYQNGSRYEGEKLNGMRHGQGKFFYQDGGLYDGQWIENKMSGRGVLFYSSGQPAYDGEWSNDQFNGQGTLYNEQPIQMTSQYDFRDFDNIDDYWIKYSGYFSEDNKEGQGTLYLSNGERFVGNFSKDFINGTGKYYTIQNQVYEGQWINNKLVQ